MLPVVFRIPGIGYEVPGYGLALTIGFLLSIVWAAYRAARSGADPDVVLNCGFFALIGGVVGSRAMYVVHYWDQYAHRGSLTQVILGIIDVRKGGLEVYGGFITVVALVLIYLWATKRSIRWYLDIVAPSAALGMCLGRVGCFLNGCCWGVTTDVPWAVRFPSGSPAAVQQWMDHVPGAGLPEQLTVTNAWPDGADAIPVPRETLRVSDQELDAGRAAYDQLMAQTKDLKDRLARATDPQERGRLEEEMRAAARKTRISSNMYVEMVAPLMSKYNLRAADLKHLAAQHPSLPVHPTQIYSVVALGLLALFLNALYWRRTRDGQVILAMLVLEPPVRMVLELLRADNPVDTLGTFTISQFLALCLSALGLLGLWSLRWLPARSPHAILWEPQPETAPQPAKSGKKSR